jgi:hypothetical protein
LCVLFGDSNNQVKIYLHQAVTEWLNFFFFFLGYPFFSILLSHFQKRRERVEGCYWNQDFTSFFCLFVFDFETGFHSNGWPEPLGWSDPPATASQVAGIYVCATVPGFVLFLNTPQLLFKSTLHSYQRLSLSLWLVLQIDGT